MSASEILIVTFANHPVEGNVSYCHFVIKTINIKCNVYSIVVFLFLVIENIFTILTVCMYRSACG